MSRWMGGWMDAQSGRIQQERQNLSNIERSGLSATASTRRDPVWKSDKPSQSHRPGRTPSQGMHPSCPLSS